MPLRNQEINEIPEALEGEKPKPRISYIKGDHARGVGPFSESIGKVDEVNLPKEKLGDDLHLRKGRPWSGLRSGRKDGEHRVTVPPSWWGTVFR